MTRDDYNKTVNKELGAIEEALRTSPHASDSLCQHHQTIMVTTAQYVGNGLADDIAARLEARLDAKASASSYMLFGRRVLKAVVHTAAYRAILLAVLSAALSKGCGIQIPVDVPGAASTAAAEQVQP